MENTKRHWSVDETKLAKNPKVHAVWRLEQRINWGLGEEKIKKEELLRYWKEIDIDPWKRKALSLALF